MLADGIFDFFFVTLLRMVLAFQVADYWLGIICSDTHQEALLSCHPRSELAAVWQCRARCQQNIWKPVREKKQRAVFWPGCDDACLVGFTRFKHLQPSPTLDFLANRTSHQCATHTLWTRVLQEVNNRPFVTIKSFAVVTLSHYVSGHKTERGLTASEAVWIE